MQNETFELIEKAVNGDKKALENLIVSVQNMIYNLSLRMLGNPNDAEDAMQEIIIKIITQLSTFRGESAFSTWIYRKRLSRIRTKVSEFLGKYCGLSKTGKCNCQKRVGYAIKTHRLNPQNLEYSNLENLKNADVSKFTDAMEKMDELSFVFEDLPKYRSPQDTKNFLKKLLKSSSMSVIKSEV